MLREMTEEEFSKEIYDFKNEKEWKFLGNKNTVIDFHAVWCSPCKMLDPIVEKLSNEFTDIDFLKIDTDKAQELAKFLDISSIPSLIFIPKIGNPKISVGAIPKIKIIKIMEEEFNESQN